MRIIIKTDGTVTELYGPQSFQQIREIINADTLDTVMLRDRIHVMLVDDLGIDKNLAFNQKATHHYWEKCGGRNDHFIRGDVVIVPDQDFA